MDDSLIVCAACLGSLGLFGNSVLQLIFLWIVASRLRASGRPVHLLLPRQWAQRTFFDFSARQLRGLRVELVPDAEAWALPVVADRVVLAHGGFKRRAVWA